MRFGKGILALRLQKCPRFWRLEGARECELKLFPPPRELGAVRRPAPRGVQEEVPYAARCLRQVRGSLRAPRLLPALLVEKFQSAG